MPIHKLLVTPPTENCSAIEAREMLIQIRDTALQCNKMDWAVGLSHCIAWMSAVVKAERVEDVG